ncbi:hypothetical protein GCM10026982_47400 [Nocardiopsis aegyptia]
MSGRWRGSDAEGHAEEATVAGPPETRVERARSAGEGWGTEDGKGTTS